MIWQDKGFLLHYAAFGERHFIATFLTQNHGRMRAWVRSNKPALVMGTLYDVVWKGRIEDHLGSCSLDTDHSCVWFMMHHQGALRALNLMCHMCKSMLPERAPMSRVFELFGLTLHQLATPNGLRAYDVFERFLLQELGYDAIDHHPEWSVFQRLNQRQTDFLTHWPHLHRLHCMRHAFVQEICNILCNRS